MELSLSLTIALWIWAVLSASAVIASATSAGWLVVNEEDEWFAVAIILLCFLASTGFLFCSILIIGQPILATWAWRILAGIAVGFGVLCCILAIGADADTNEALSVFGSTALATVLFALSILAGLKPISVVPQATSTPSAVEVVFSQITFWHNATLTILALGTLTFLVLFIAAIRRGILPAIESHWGGLGGGLGGWQMSPSLSYLIGAVVFGVLFSVLILREESSPRVSMPNLMMKEGTTPKLEEKPKPKKSNDLDSGVSLPPVAAPAPAPTTE